MNHTCRGFLNNVCTMTDEEREVARIEMEIKNLEAKKKRILSKKNKDYAQSLIDCAESVCVEQLDGKTIIVLS